MSAGAQIDYDALAAKHGATIDYDALAAKHGATAVDSGQQQTKNRGFFGTLGDKFSGLADEFRKEWNAPSEPEPKTKEEMWKRNEKFRDEIANAPVAIAQQMKYQATRPIPKDLNSPSYRAATTLSPLVPALNPEAMEKASAKGDTGAVAAEAAIPTALAVAPLAGEGLYKGAKAVLPSTERSGTALGQVRAAAGGVPIDMSGPGKTALELYTQSQRGATLPKVVRDFVNRATKPGAEPITYAEAKDFQSNVSSLSADEKMASKPNTLRLIGQLNSDLKASLEAAADTVGKGRQFADAMKEFHHAMQLKGFTENMIKAAIGAAITGAGVAGVKTLWKAFP